MYKIAILGDIHGNLFALQSVIHDLNDKDIRGLIFLGDLIDYGMQSNEVVEFFRHENPYPVLGGIWGNHERAILLEDFARFSSNRGVESAQYTKRILKPENRTYLSETFENSGKLQLQVHERSCLIVHGSLADTYWKAIRPDWLGGEYAAQDIVLSGHSHYPHCFYYFYDCDNEAKRNKKAVLFVNPGSVGQPRNHNPRAQYAILDFENLSVEMCAVPYDVDGAMNLYFDQVDLFYRDRLKYGV